MPDPTEALREALDETLRPYLDQTGWSAQAIDQMLVAVTARLSGFHGVAAQRAAAGMARAKSPARRRSRVRDVRGVSLPRRLRRGRVMALTELRGNPVCWICERPIRDGFAGAYVRVSLDDGRVVDIDDDCYAKVDEPREDDHDD